MAKLSDLFGRKGGMAGADKFTGRSQNGNGNGGDHISVENLSDVGSRMGEENEVLRNLLTDTGRKISELDALKEAFDKLVTPFNSTLRALEQEKSQTSVYLACWRRPAPPTKPCVLNSTRPRKRRRYSNPKLKDFVKILSCRAKQIEAWKAPALN